MVSRTSKVLVTVLLATMLVGCTRAPDDEYQSSIASSGRADGDEPWVYTLEEDGVLVAAPDGVHSIRVGHGGENAIEVVVRDANGEQKLLFANGDVEGTLDDASLSLLDSFTEDALRAMSGADASANERGDTARDIVRGHATWNGEVPNEPIICSMRARVAVLVAAAAVTLIAVRWGKHVRTARDASIAVAPTPEARRQILISSLLVDGVAAYAALVAVVGVELMFAPFDQAQADGNFLSELLTSPRQVVGTLGGLVTNLCSHPARFEARLSDGVVQVRLAEGSHLTGRLAQAFPVAVQVGRYGSECAAGGGFGYCGSATFDESWIGSVNAADLERASANGGWVTLDVNAPEALVSYAPSLRGEKRPHVRVFHPFATPLAQNF